MQATRRLFPLVVALGFAASASFAVAQVVTATLPVGQYPQGAAVNFLTNKIYVTNQCGNDPSCASVGTVTVIDGPTNNTQTVTVGYFPGSVAVNSTTNKIYVANACGNDPTCGSTGTVTVIDGVTNNTETVSVGYSPYYGMAINPVTNKIYVITYNYSDYTVTVIDGIRRSGAAAGRGKREGMPSQVTTPRQAHVGTPNRNTPGDETLGSADAGMVRTPWLRRKKPPSLSVLTHALYVHVD